MGTSGAGQRWITVVRSAALGEGWQGLGCVAGEGWQGLGCDIIGRIGGARLCYRGRIAVARLRHNRKDCRMRSGKNSKILGRFDAAW